MPRVIVIAEGLMDRGAPRHTTVLSERVYTPGEYERIAAELLEALEIAAELEPPHLVPMDRLAS